MSPQPLFKNWMFSKIVSISIIISFIFPLSARAGVWAYGYTPILETKTAGKLTMIAMLSVAAVIVKMLVDRDRKEAIRLCEKFGPPDRIIEFQEGFDHWCMEWHGNRVYIFRNNIIYKNYSTRKPYE